MNYNDEFKQCLEVLKKGGIILYPTDTVWGIGCDATNAAAVEKIFTIKSREENKSLLILVNGIDMMERYVRDVPRIAYELAQVSEDPLTIIYPQGKNLAPGVCAPDGSVGIRICNDDFCSQLIDRFRKPIVSTSANTSGKPSPQFFAEIEKAITEKVDYVVKYRQEDRSKKSPSPVIKVNADSTVSIIRK
jgi:L-threonylcarbamoyladenylate synthase